MTGSKGRRSRICILVLLITFISFWLFADSLSFAGGVSLGRSSLGEPELSPQALLSGDSLANWAGSAITTEQYLPAVIRPPDPAPGWLLILNQHRALANLPPLTENIDWSAGDWLHSRYMVKNDYVGHSEEPGDTWYTPEGLAAAQSGNVFVSSWPGTTDESSIDFWMTAPFHAVGILDPELSETGFGSYRESVGTWQMGATLDVLRGRGSLPEGISFPLPYPRDGGQSWSQQYGGGEFPDPLTSCPGYHVPTGPPIMLQIGSGNLTPNVTSHSLVADGTVVESCLFDETSYTNPDSAMQNLGRQVLNSRDAIVIMPRQPLSVAQHYTVNITANGQTTSWQFEVIDPADRLTPQPEAVVQMR